MHPSCRAAELATRSHEQADDSGESRWVIDGGQVRGGPTSLEGRGQSTGVSGRLERHRGPAPSSRGTTRTATAPRIGAGQPSLVGAAVRTGHAIRGRHEHEEHDGEHRRLARTAAV